MKHHQPKRFHRIARTTTGLDRNASASARGYGWRWQQYTKRRRISHPYCEALHCYPCGLVWKKGHAPANCPKCKKEPRICGKPMRCTDHIKPVTGPDDPLFFDERNHESCCWPCHSALTVREDGGLGRSKKR
jgi:hypothetical protein